MLFSVIRVDLLVLDRDIVTTKDIDGFSPWVMKVGQVVNDAVDANFGRLELIHVANAFRGGGLLGLGNLAPLPGFLLPMLVREPKVAQKVGQS